MMKKILIKIPKLCIFNRLPGTFLTSSRLYIIDYLMHESSLNLKTFPRVKYHFRHPTLNEFFETFYLWRNSLSLFKVQIHWHTHVKVSQSYWLFATPQEGIEAQSCVGSWTGALRTISSGWERRWRTRREKVKNKSLGKFR